MSRVFPISSDLMNSRRHFLSTGAAALAAPSFLLRAANAPAKFRTALIGTGWWGMNILREAVASRRV